VDSLEVAALTPYGQTAAAALEKTFTLPGPSRQLGVPELETPAETSPAATSPTTEEPAVPSLPIMAHMASMLEQAQLIARDLRPKLAPAPISRAPVTIDPATPPGPPSQSATPAQMTMRYANSLLKDSRFEEALQAFLELSSTG
jgi:hypothetical protein